ncbi:MAG: hypothetical protein WCR42_11415 [bacterium]
MNALQNNIRIFLNLRKVKSLAKKIILILLLNIILSNFSISQPFLVNLNPQIGEPCDCQILNSSDEYINNGGFECVDQFSIYEGKDKPADRKYAQFEYAVGGVIWENYKNNTYMIVPNNEDKYTEGLVKGWFSPTYYTPNHFYHNPIAHKYSESGFGFSHNHLYGYPFYYRYPRDWVMQGTEPYHNNSNNFGYAGFWADPKKFNVDGKEVQKDDDLYIEYIQQKLKQPLVPGQGYILSYYVSKNNDKVDGSQKIGVYFSEKAPRNFDNLRTA